ncbi:hypothetical protein ACHAXR_003441 [Thalassiosira sp. AJA248-18]
MAAVAKLLLGSLIFAVHSTISCLGFVPTCSRHCSTQHNQQQQFDDLIVSRSRPRISSSSELSGLANVNDYFASFNDNDGSDDDESKNDESISSDKAVGKYMGHGRIGGDGDEGGVFDVQNYFSSFDDDNASHDGASPAITAPSFDEQLPTPTPVLPVPIMTRMTYEEIVAYNNARLCPKLLLTQTAIQSFIYMLDECRDPHSGKWIEDFLGLQNLRNYHGTGAFNITQHPTWDAVLYDIMRQPNDKMIVSAKRRGRGHGGWSKNNPYLQERWVEFKIDIRPASLVQRLLPVREQLAMEFMQDLDIVGMVDKMVMDSYFDKIRDLPQQQQQQQPPSWAFDRISVNILTNFTEFQESGSSPFRRGNFDLLYSLCTQASAHRLLRELQQSTSSYSSDNEITYEWFKQFYTEHVPEYFDGDQSFGRADDFIDALLCAPPSLVEMSDGKRVGLNDPLRIAERIIAIRSEIAQEWKMLMGEVKNDHLQLNDVLIRVMMGRTIDESGNEVVEIHEERTVEDLSDSTTVWE